MRFAPDGRLAPERKVVEYASLWAWKVREGFSYTGVSVLKQKNVDFLSPPRLCHLRLRLMEEARDQKTRIP